MDKKEKACNRRQTIDANLNATIVIIITVLLPDGKIRPVLNSKN